MSQNDDKLFDALELVRDEETFLQFLLALRDDRKASIAQEAVTPSSPYASDARAWEITVKQNSRWVNIAWGPLSGFGTTDLDNLREDSNPFGSHDWPMENAEAAIEFVVRVVGGAY